MSEALYPYYERELLFIRRLSQEFAKQYPAAAGRLLLEPGRSSDPHIERLIESFALLAGRIHHKLDDEFPELTDALLGTLYPHYLAPVPSMAIVQFVVDPTRAPMPDGFLIPAQSRMQTQPVSGLPCKFRTTYPVTLWPIEVTNAALLTPPFPPGIQPPPRTAAVLQIQLECQGGLRFCDLQLETLRLYLSGGSQVIATLYDLIFNHTQQVTFRSLDAGTSQRPIQFLPAQCLSQVGFERDEGMLPYPAHVFPGYRLLTEFFAFPNKFQFMDLSGWKRVAQAGFEKRVEVLLFLDRTQADLEQGIDTSTFRLGCTPLVNLFEQIAEPIPLTHARHEYRIVPDVGYPLGMEVYSVGGVSSTDATTSVTTDYEPFYSFRHGKSTGNQQTFWYATRKPSTKEGDRGTDVFLNLVDLGFHPRLPADSTLVVRTTCTNRNLSTQLQRAGEQLAFDLETAAPLARIRCLRSPTMSLRPPLRHGAHWRLVSHLNLNHLSLTDAVQGREALQEILRLYDFADAEMGPQLAAVNRFLIEGVIGLSSRRVVGRIVVGNLSDFARGLEVTLELDEQKYLGTGVYMFASVLERFLGLYASINSFTQLVVKTKQGEGYFKKWPPRAGEVPML